MFLRKIIKSFGLFVLIFCIAISMQNELITTKASIFIEPVNDGSEIILDEQGIDTIQPSQIYTVELNLKNISSQKDIYIDKLHIQLTNVLTDTGQKYGTNINVRTNNAVEGYHYAISFWKNGERAVFGDGWQILDGHDDAWYNNFLITSKNIELKIEKMECDKIVTDKKTFCTTDGYIEYTCELCKRVYTEPMKATGHTYAVAKRTYPTVYSSGAFDYYCKKCGDEYTSEMAQYEFNISVGGSQLKAIKLGHNLLFANTHNAAKYIPFVVSNGKSVFDIK